MNHPLRSSLASAPAARCVPVLARAVVRTCASALGLILALGAPPAHALDPIVAEGDACPLGGTFTRGGRPLGIDANDRIYFESHCSSQAFSDEAVFVYDDGVITTIAASGDAAPDSGGDVFFDFDSGVVTPAGDVVVLAGFRPPGGTISTGYFVLGANAQRLVATGDPVPGTASSTFTSFELASESVNDSLEVAFVGNYPSGFAHGGVFLASPSGVEKVAIGTDPVQGGGTVSDTGIGLILTQAAIVGSGDVAFSARDPGNNLRLLRESGGVITEEPANIGLEWVVGNEAGDWTYQAAASQGVGLAFNVLSNGVETTRTLPDAPETGGGTFGSLLPLAMNDAREILFFAGVSSGTAANGYFLSTASDVQDLLLEGASAPGSNGGTFDNLLDAVRNQAGTAAFGVTLENGDFASAIYTVPEPASTLAAAAAGAVLTALRTGRRNRA